MPANNSSPYVESLSVSNGIITVAFHNTGNTDVDAGSLMLSPDTSQGNVRWICQPNDAALNAYMPSNCRSGS